MKKILTSVYTYAIRKTWILGKCLKIIKTIDITANKRYNRYIKINVLGLVLSTAVTRYGCRG